LITGSPADLPQVGHRLPRAQPSGQPRFCSSAFRDNLQCPFVSVGLVSAIFFAVTANQMFWGELLPTSTAIGFTISPLMFVSAAARTFIA